MDTAIHDKLIIRYLEGNATIEESKKISEWLDLDEKNKQYFIAIKKTFIELQLAAGQNSSETDKAYNKFLEKVNQKNIEKAIQDEEEDEYLLFNRTILKYAAVIILMISVCGIAFYIGKASNKTQKNQYCEISAPLGGKSSVILPDGTKIWLNAGSKIRYSGEFNTNNRDVFLEGEAYFDVTKKKQPFIVHTSDIDIRVFGTSFNVKSYPDEDKIETTLVEGSIRVDRKESKKPLYLSPNEKLVFHKQNMQAEIKTSSVDTFVQKNQETVEKPTTISHDSNPVEISKNINVDESVSWKDGSLIFNQESLETLTKKLERKYDITFTFENDELKKYSFSGTLRDFPLEQVLKAIKYTSPINYSINEKNVVLSYNKKYKY